MQLKFSPAIKGLITAMLMVTTFLFIYYKGIDADARWQYLVYLIYAMGIFWTLISFHQTNTEVAGFGTYFNQGFKCFIVVTLLIALFYGLFNMFHPEFAEESAQYFKEGLLASNQKTPLEIDQEVITFKKQYTLKLVSGAIFGYLIIGAAVTAVLAVLFTRRK